MKTDTTHTLGHLLHVSLSSCSFGQIYTSNSEIQTSLILNKIGEGGYSP
jgi:hypothetical protein